MKKTVYNNKTALGGIILAEIGCDYYKVLWNDGTESIVNINEIETSKFKRLIYYLPNLQFRIENNIDTFMEDKRLDTFIVKIIAVGFLALTLALILTIL
ncbi:MAG TPA: hypothetical protein DCS19_07960 [Flavobacterium sp.]|nr:hypothetical protein [Flavobacterium sp.]